MNPLFSRAPVAMLLVAIVGARHGVLFRHDWPGANRHQEGSRLLHRFAAWLHVLGVRRGRVCGRHFPLMTHAFFKGLLFLAAGSVIHAMGGEQDMRKMGGLRKQIPVTYWTMLIATLAIAGIPGFAGFFSKDEILEAAQNRPARKSLALAAGS